MDQETKEMQATVETLIKLDEPEALLATLRHAASRKSGERWQRLTTALLNAEKELEDEGAAHARRKAPEDNEPKSE